ncbi:hypothetical protein ENU1_097380 [Entamoeba nuttalli P19]|uniref:Uncharacterized protein n=2 Tax=Entamoeba nuttalli TaxID=412467 RepID=K2GYB2_ENTNP|nr:hypothetical protein ENU1_097380 [Entamoeba nuttalli P19]EKE40233.1 hypothetical protein ENU1_097380 [Entamoeba nuttalli P19]|eukprot:XP_008857431.1 hypothetical protein ENU1_097380 [Entamoeba nuttalli P19]
MSDNNLHHNNSEINHLNTPISQPSSKLPKLLFNSTPSLQPIKLPKPPVTSIQQVPSVPAQLQPPLETVTSKKNHKKGSSSNDDETETNSDSETLVSSCSDTVDEGIITNNITKEKKVTKEKKPRKRITMPKKPVGEKRQYKRKEKKESVNDGLKPLSSINNVTSLSKLENTTASVDIAPLNIKEDEKFLPKVAVDLKNRIGMIEEKENEEKKVKTEDDIKVEEEDDEMYLETIEEETANNTNTTE